MSLESTNWLSEKCGMERKTISKRLESLTPIADGRSKLYDTKDALPLIYGVAGGGAQGDLSRERALLARVQRQKIELETAILRADVIPSEVVKEVWSQLLAACRARLLALPSRIATLAITATTHAEIEQIAGDLVHEALNELSEFQAEQYRSKRARAAHLQGCDTDSETAAEVDSESMGKSEPDVKPRRQRRAGQVQH